MYGDAELVVDARAVVGEGPSWDVSARTLLWVDIPNGNIHTFDPSTSTNTTRTLDEIVSVVVNRSVGGYLIGTHHGVATLEESGPATLVATIERDIASNRLNDGKVDHQGRLWIGTMSSEFQPQRGSLYRVDADFSVHLMVKSVTTSNGLAWSADDRRMYYIDTRAYSLDVFDFERELGSISNRRTLVSFDPEYGRPDGMAIDADDHLWVAIYGGGEVRRFAPDGSHLGEVKLPVRQVTSCAFGGPDYQDLYITSAGQRLAQDPEEPEPFSGGLFRARPGAQGVPPTAFAG